MRALLCANRLVSAHRYFSLCQTNQIYFRSTCKHVVHLCVHHIFLELQFEQHLLLHISCGFWLPDGANYESMFPPRRITGGGKIISPEPQFGVGGFSPTPQNLAKEHLGRGGEGSQREGRKDQSYLCISRTPCSNATFLCRLSLAPCPTVPHPSPLTVSTPSALATGSGASRAHTVASFVHGHVS